MCFPIVLGIDFDSTSYSAGQTITATVLYTSCCSGPFMVAGADSGNRTWTLVSNDGVSTAILQATA